MESKTFTGNVYFFHAFDVGEDINLEKVKNVSALRVLPLSLPKYFKNYQIPLNVELPSHTDAQKYHTIKINDFGAISICYKVPFNDTLENVRTMLGQLDTQYREYAIIDAQEVFKIIAPYTKQAYFYQQRTDYALVQVDFDPQLDTREFKEKYGATIAELIRFETETLADYQKQDILESAIGYYRGDLIIIDSEAAFIYDEEYTNLLDLFEFSNIQHA